MRRTHIQVTHEDKVMIFPTLDEAATELKLSKGCLYRKDILKGFTYEPKTKVSGKLKPSGKKYYFIKLRSEKIKV